MTQSIDLYGILKVEKDATSSSIRKAYHKMALIHHPDKLTKPEDPQIFLNIQLSYQILSDENKRKLYDESGDIHIAMGLNHSEKSEKEWKNYFNAIFNKVTIDELIKFEKEYKGSELEKQDVLDTYTKYKGSMDKLFECVPFSSALAESNDEERFKLIIQEAIDNGKVELYTKFKSDKSKKRRLKNAERERAEAEELAQELGITLPEPSEASNTQHEDGIDPALANLIMSRKKNQSAQFDVLIGNIEAKYVKKKKTKKT